MFGIDDALLIYGAGAAISGAQAIWGGKPTSEQEDMLKWLEGRMKEGLSTAEEQQYYNAFAPKIDRQRSAALSRVSDVFAARGTSGSTAHKEAITGIPSTAEVIAPEIIRADTAAKTGATDAFFGLQNQLEELRQANIQAGLGGIVSAAGQYGASLMPNDFMTMDDFLKFLPLWMGTTTRFYDDE